MWFDGTERVLGGGVPMIPYYEPIIIDHLADESSMAMNAVGFIGSNSGQVDVHIDVEWVEYSIVTLQFVLIEHGLVSDDTYNYVARDLLDPEYLVVSSPGQTFDVHRDFTIQGNWNPANMDIVTLVQYDGNREVLQACMGMDSTPGDLTVDLTYLSGSPVPAGGGNIYFDIYVENIDAVPLNFDGWLETAYEGGTPTTVILRSFNNFQPGWTIDRPNTYFPVPAAYAAGNYTLTGKVGNHPDDAWAQDNFPFVKSGVSYGSDFVPFVPDGMPDPFDVIDKGSLEQSLPAQFEVSGVYPNPFNPTTTIGFALPQGRDVKLSVFDVNGRLVSTLVDGYREAGSHEVTFDAHNLPSGVYLYQLTAGNFNATGKMVLTK